MAPERPTSALRWHQQASRRLTGSALGGTETTLRLHSGSLRVELRLVTNAWMSRTDKATELERQGLL